MRELTLEEFLNTLHRFKVRDQTGEPMTVIPIGSLLESVLRNGIRFVIDDDT